MQYWVGRGLISVLAVMHACHVLKCQPRSMYPCIALLTWGLEYYGNLIIIQLQ